MRSRWIAFAGKARRFRRQRCGGVRTSVETREQRLSTRLPRDTHEGGEIIRRSAGDAALCHTAIAVAVENASVFIHGDFVEVEKIAVLVAAALLPDSGGMLNGIIRCRVNRHPVCPVVVSRGDERVPIPREAYCLVITGDISTEEADCGAAAIAAYGLNFGGVHDALGSADIDVIRPGDRVRGLVQSANGDAGMPFQRLARRHWLVIDVRVVDPAVGIYGDGRISAFGLRNSIGHDKLMPGDTTIGAERAALLASALVHR